MRYLLLFVLIIVSSSDILAQSTQLPPCERALKLVGNKIRLMNGEEIEQKIELIISPIEKTILLKSEHKKKGKVQFVTTISSIECNLNSDLTKGQAIYKGYVTQPDGTRKNSVIQITASQGEILVSESDPDKGRQAQFYMIVNKAE